MPKIEIPPQITATRLTQALLEEQNEELVALVSKINENYEYWDTVKYKSLPKNCSAEKLWAYVKASRLKQQISVWPKYGITLSITNQMQRHCHEFDMNFGTAKMDDNALPPDAKEHFLVSSLMEEAISSSQMEGANTTRRVAKDMLRKQTKPNDKSQQMIANNYQTMHKLMTEKTLNNNEDAGRFRTNDEVVVADGITNEVVHQPPSYKDIEPFVADLCRFFNHEEQTNFIHPLIKGIVIHFMLAFVHPFVDGNGRTARALFYWYLLRRGYWLTQYLSVSRMIARSKKSYEKSFLYTETDGNDMGYFVSYNMRVLQQSFNELQTYIQRKQKKRLAANTYLQLGGINERQAQIIQLFADNPKAVVTIKELQNKFFVTPTTAKADIMALINRKLVTEFAFNKVKKGYMRSEYFEDAIKALS